ncbi:MAG: hypothetical protein J6V50_05160 [Clostridia bacterium]|nr:hypothetical protein [Clostridia bacterium]
MKRIIAFILTVVLVAGLFAGCGSNSSELLNVPIARPEFAKTTPYTDINNEEFVLAAEKGGLKLYFQPLTTHFMVENKADGSVWYSNPQNANDDEYASRLIQMQMNSTLLIEYLNVDNQKIETLNLYTVVRSKKYNIKLVEDGVLFDYDVSEVGKKFYFAVRLSDNHVYTDIWYENLEETKPNIFINSLSVAPYFLSGRLGDEGYLFLPDGSGALVNFDKNNITADSYSRPIYGEEPTSVTRDWYLQAAEATIKLPVIGVRKNGSALFAIAENCAEIGTVNANACGQKTSYANVYISYSALNFVEYKLGTHSSKIFNKKIKDIETITTRYYFLTGDDADYSGMARTYRDYLAQKYSLNKATVNDTFYTDVYAGAFKKVSTLGVPHDKFVPLTTTEQLASMCEQIGKIGAENIVVRYKNWNTDELKGKRVDSAKAHAALSYNELSNFSKAEVYPSVSTHQSYTSGGYIDALASAGFSTVGVPFSMDGFNKSNLQSNGTITRWIAFDKIAPMVQTYMGEMSDKGFKNIAFVDVSNRLYSDFRGETYLRNSTKKLMENLMEEADGKFDKVMLDGANDYALRFGKVIFNTPVSHSMHDILAGSVPFYSIAVGGLIDCVAPSFNGEFANDDLWLLAAASGTYFCYSFMNAASTEILSTSLKSHANMNFDSNFGEATKAYNEMKKITEAASGSRIYSHSYITETLTVTEYENGTKVYVNFADNETVFDLLKIPAKAFVVTGGEK